jgi:RNA polymerase sigma-70 factor (sigma-E family)
MYVTEIAPVFGGAGDAMSAGSEQFEEFMTSRWPGLVRLAYGLTGDKWQAEDLAQTALASAYAAWWRVSRADDPDAYVRRILINASKSRFRRNRLSERPQAAVDLPGPAVPDHASAIGDRSVLFAALAELPPRQRAAVVLRYWEDMTDAQAGAVLGCTASTVRSQLARALTKLRASGALTGTGPMRQTPRQPGGAR